MWRLSICDSLAALARAAQLATASCKMLLDGLFDENTNRGETTLWIGHIRSA